MYLSEDNKWDIDDTEMAKPQCIGATLRSQSPVAYSATNIKAPLVLDAELYGVVRSRSNIRDFHLDNNIGISSSTLHVSYPELVLDVPSTKKGLKDTAGYIVHGVPFGKTLIVTVQSPTGLHDIYARHARPATAYQYDSTSTYPSAENQESIIPFTKEGDYYILIENTDTVDSEVSILVKIAKFEILTVTPAKISNQKSSTLHIRGTMFGENCNVHLVNNEAEVFAVKVYRMSSTDIYAKFVGPLKEGEYMVKLVNIFTGQEVFSPNMIKVTLSVPGKFTSSMLLQRSMRPNRVGDGRVILQNSGNADVTGLFLVLESYGIGNLQLLQGKAITPFQDKFWLIPFVDQGPTGILYPKSLTTLDFLMGLKVSSTQGTILVRLSYSPLQVDDTNPFLERESEYRVRESLIKLGNTKYTCLTSDGL